MVGYRRTHDYPHGKPFSAGCAQYRNGVPRLLWVFFVPGHWPRVGIISAVLLIASIDRRLRSAANEPVWQCVFLAEESLIGFPTVYLFQCWRLLKGMKIVDGSAEAGRALTAEVAFRGLGGCRWLWCSDQKPRTSTEFECNLKLR
jgi:hypothetical protein